MQNPRILLQETSGYRCRVLLPFVVRILVFIGSWLVVRDDGNDAPPAKQLGVLVAPLASAHPDCRSPASRVLPATPVSVAGDLWHLGDNRLLVGDATSREAVSTLMAGDAADLVFTDLPYNVDYEGYTEEHLKIQGDRMSAAEFKQFLEAAFRSYRTLVKPGASLYVCHSSSWQREFQDAMEAAGFEVRCQIIWAKNTFAWGFGRYKFRHEQIYSPLVTGQKYGWYGDKSHSTLWEENKPAANRLHPTMKPV